LEEKKRNYQTAINLYSSAIDLAPEKRDIYEARIKELNTSFRILADLEEKYRAGDYMAAIKGYSELLKKPSLNANYSNSDYYLGRAKCFDKLGQLTRSYNEQVKNYNDALKDYAKSNEYDSDNMETIRCRADLYRRMNRN
jgi:tetratricopeptide (TPR) repeat protein